MSVSRLLVAGVVVALTLVVGSPWVAGCDSGNGVSSASTGSSTLITLNSRPVELTWIPSDSPSADDQARVADTLRLHDLHFLLPSTPPVADPAAVSAHFILSETIPTKEITLELVVRHGEDANPIAAVQSWVGNPAQGASETQAVRIRGQDGQARVAPGVVSILQWVEDGQQYYAEWVGLPLDEVVAWLDAWRSIPGE
jgi:hypothetical protein